MPLSAAAASPAPISRIARFYISRELGRGTTGTVYLGHDPVLGRDVALKTLNSASSAADRQRSEQQFVNEARAAARLSHPNIVTIYDASIEGASIYIAMEYLQGRELSKILLQGYRFRPAEAASIIWKLADALGHAHRNGVVHRDIKPANIFMIDDLEPKLVDFGIARAPNRVPLPGAEATTLFHHNLLGTPNYMSPEQAAGKPVDARTDLYSLGAVMYEMLVGRKPFQSDDQDRLLQQIASKSPTAPHELNADVPQALSSIVMKALTKRAEKRYQSAEEMARDLKRYLVRTRSARKSAASVQLAVATLDRKVPKRGARRLAAWIACIAFSALGLAAALASIVRFIR